MEDTPRVNLARPAASAIIPPKSRQATSSRPPGTLFEQSARMRLIVVDQSDGGEGRTLSMQSGMPPLSFRITHPRNRARSICRPTRPGDSSPATQRNHPAPSATSAAARSRLPIQSFSEMVARHGMAAARTG